MKTVNKNVIILACIAVGALFAACSGSDKGGVSSEDSARIANEAIAHAKRETAPQRSSRPEAKVSDIPQSKMLTQYCFVEITERGPEIRGNIETLLKNLGFTIKEGYVPPVLDSPDDTEYFGNPWNASRKSSTGTTSISLKVSDVRSICTVNFANPVEFNRFMETLEKTNYTKQGNTYRHNSKGRSDSFIKSTLTVDISPQCAIITARYSAS